MKTNRPVQYLATPARGFMTTLLVLLVVVIVQMSSLEIARVLLSRRPAPTTPVSDQELTAEQRRTHRIWRARREFLPDGMLHLITQVGGPRYGSQYEPEASNAQVQVYDTNDNLLWDGPTRELPYDYLAWAQYVHRDSFEASDLHRRVQTITSDAKTIDFPLATADELLKKWRYSPQHDCLVGYDLTNGKFGYLGANGLTNDQTEVQPFGRFASFLAWWPPDSLSPTLLWQTDRRLYQINFDRQQVALIFESPDSDMVDLRISRWDSYRPEDSTADANDRPLLACRTRDGNYYLILKNPGQTIRVAIPDDWGRWVFDHCNFAATKQGVFLVREWIAYPKPATRRDSNWQREYREATKTQWTELYRVDDAGNLDLANRYSWTVPGEQRSAALAGYRDVTARVKLCVKAFSPFLCDLVWTGLLRDHPPSSHNSELWRGFDQFVDELRPDYRVGNWLITAVMLVLTFLHARCRQGSKGMLSFWLVFVALLNVTGFLVYWALNDTAVSKCPACGKRRGLKQVNCVRCQAPLPAPEHGRLDLIFGL